VNADGHTSSPPRLIECANDKEAICVAKQLLDGRLVEVWDEARRVAKLEPE
jgi:hypothetical protein